MNTEATGRWRDTWLGLLLVASTLFSHAGHARSFLNWDDDDYVTENPIVRDGFTASGVRRAFLEAHAANWHPLTWLSHMADVEIYGLDAHAHQRTSLWLHALAALLLFAFLRSTTRSSLASFLAAALFALHPQRTESVQWISERKDVLAGVCWSAALCAYASYARRPGVWRMGLVTLLFVAGTLSKASVVTLPVVLLLLDLWPLGRAQVPLRRRLWEKAHLFALAAVVAGIAVHTQSAYGTTSTTAVLSVPVRVANAGLAAWAYLRQFFWPTGLQAFYPHPALADPGFRALAPAPVAALAALALLLALAWRQRRGRPWLLVGLSWFLVVLLPMSGLIQVGEQGRADRYTYLPSMGLAIAVVFSAQAAFGRREALLATVSLPALVVLAVRSRIAAVHWSDTRTLFEHELETNPSNWVALNQLAHEALTRGDLVRAEELARRQLVVHPDAKAHGNLAAVLIAREAWRGAERQARRALALDPESAEAANNLGIALAQLGRDEEAAESFLRAATLRPSYVDAWVNLGRLELARGRPADAVPPLERARRLDPGSPEIARLLARARG